MKIMASNYEISVGDRVLSKHYRAIGTVKDIRKDKKCGMLYGVQFNDKVLQIRPWNYAQFMRYGITKNYDADGHEVLGNAQYYREEMEAPYWGKEKRKVFGMEIYPPNEKHSLWLVCEDILSKPEQLTIEQLSQRLAEEYAKHCAET